MYSLVMMATLAAPATMPDCHPKRSCYGCYGCYGSVCSGCSGSCSGCYGSRSYGCSGCHGSCSGCSGCYGSAYYYTGSCWGGHSCYGCSGCAGSGCSGVRTAYPPSYETAPAAPAAPAPAPADAGKKADASASPARVLVSLPADAKLYVDGQLTKTADKAVRSFLTPELEDGVEYRYVMKAEVVRDGIPQTETQTVVVRAGQEARADFGSLLDTRTASNR